MSYAPPYKITSNILNLVAKISELLGNWSASQETTVSPQLRRGNRLRTIQSSLAIENNTLTLEQVTAVIEGKRVLGLPREIQEVRNAFNAYENLPLWQPTNAEHLLSAHRLMMYGLVDDAGHHRNEGVGIYRDDQLIHMAPPAQRVGKLIADLLDWLETTDCHPLVASCVFHYEFEFIHPFTDGNGRVGRLWQTLYLSQWQDMFEYLPVESVIKDQQDAYYRALSESDRSGESTNFIVFMLNALLKTMKEVSLMHQQEHKPSDQVNDQVSDQVKTLLTWLNNKEPQKLSVIMKALSLKHRPTFKNNYLEPALIAYFIAMTNPDSPRNPNQKYFLTTLGKEYLNVHFT